MRELGVYIHIPFCVSKCPYCDFYSIKYNESNIDNYITNLNNKILQWGQKLNGQADTLYFGGGTPSCIGEERLSYVAKTAIESFSIKNAEITVEVNPSKQDFDFEKIRKNGFNRVSVGLQSADNNELKILGRLHNTDQAKNCIKKAQSSGFDNISLDLMIATPMQTKESLERSIEFCAKNNVQHISAYILKIEKGTEYAKIKDTLNLADDDQQAEMYLFACEKIKEYGYNQYEISNFAKKGFESRHNIKYWNDEEYIGIGASAHSFIDKKRFYYPRSIKDFYKGIIIDDGYGGNEEEYIMLKLRLASGINNLEYKKRFGYNIPQRYFINAKKFQQAGYTYVDENNIKLTTNGFILSNALITEILK